MRASRISTLVLLLVLSVVGCPAPKDGPRGEGEGEAGEGEGEGETGEGEGEAAEGEGEAGEGEGEAGEGEGEGEPACGALATRVTVTSLSTGGAQVDVGFEGGFSSEQPVIFSPLPGGGARIGWKTTGGEIRVTTVDDAFTRVGNDVIVAGSELRGLAARPDGAGLLVVRGDAMLVVRIDEAGAELFATPLVGNNDHTTEGDRWVDFWPHDGRLLFDGTGFAAYHGQSGNHGAQGDHQGDRYELIDETGARSTIWDWGCSHSMDMRLAHGPAGTAAVCLSDCFPVKGILFNHRERVLRDEPSGNCAGSSEAQLGGVVASATGFWTSFASPEGRTSRDVGLVHVDGTNGVSTPVFLTADDADDTAPHLAALGAQRLLAGWRANGAHTIAVLDAAGAVVEGPVVLEGGFALKDDFATLHDGDVAWAAARGTTIDLVRVEACD